MPTDFSYSAETARLIAARDAALRRVADQSLTAHLRLASRLGAARPAARPPLARVPAPAPETRIWRLTAVRKGPHV